MSTYLYTSVEPIATTGSVIQLGGNTPYKYLSAVEISGEEVTLVGHWGNDGSKVFCDEAMYQTHFRAFANTEDGFATDGLDFHHWQGHKQRQMQVAAEEEPVVGHAEYPATDQPFSLSMEHFEVTEGTWQGHGWKCWMLSNDPNRDILARAIGIYSDPACENYLYTTGAFVMTDTGEVDELDNPILRPMCECPLGQLKAEKEPIHYALLLGSAQEGVMNLPVETDVLINNFWSK